MLNDVTYATDSECVLQYLDGYYGTRIIKVGKVWYYKNKNNSHVKCASMIDAVINSININYEGNYEYKPRS